MSACHVKAARPAVGVAGSRAGHTRLHLFLIVLDSCCCSRWRVFVGGGVLVLMAVADFVCWWVFVSGYCCGWFYLLLVLLLFLLSSRGKYYFFLRLIGNYVADYNADHMLYKCMLEEAKLRNKNNQWNRKANKIV